MDPVTSPLIHKDSGRQGPRRSGRGASPRRLRGYELAMLLMNMLPSETT